MTSPESAVLERRPYEGLASIYDFVMRHVDYPAWGNYVASLLRRHECEPGRLLDLACGTGNASFALAAAGYRLTGYDASEEMVRVAREKASRQQRDLRFGVRDLRDLSGVGEHGAAVCLYDSLNYLLTLEEVGEALTQVHAVLPEGAVFIFDICTEQNSVRHFGDVRSSERGLGFSFRRHSHYASDERLQHNDFDICFEDGSRVRETHVQRIYECGELAAAVDASPFELVELLDGFSLRPGSDLCDRVHFVLRR